MAENGGGPLVVGIDLGGTKILAGVVSADNQILGRAKRSTPAKEGGDAILEAMVGCVDDALAEAGIGRDDFAAAGIGSPGPLDVETGTILFSANLNVRDFALGPRLSEAIGRPVLLQNDVGAGGYGEFRLGAGQGFDNIVAAFVGTGIGGFVVVDGRVVKGSTGNAGELGHMILKANGPRCGCGNRGCMEALASRTAITRRIGKAVRHGAVTVLDEKVAKKSARLKSGEISAAVAAGDPLVTREVRRAAHFLGMGLAGLVNVLGPQIVIIGGGVTEALGQPFVELVRESLRPQAIADSGGQVRVERAALGDDAGVLGSALLAREKFLTTLIA